MLRKTEMPFADWPDTRALPQGGVHLTGRYLHPMTPRRVQVAFTLIAIFGTIWLWSESGKFGGSMVLGGLFAVICLAVLAPLTARLLRKKIDMQVHDDRILVKGRFGNKRFPRVVPMEFRAEPHRKGTEEARREQKNGKRGFTTFRDAVEVVMQYGERRVPLAALRMKDIDKANALAFRLQAICEGRLDMVHEMAPAQPGRAERAHGDFGPSPDLR